MPIRILFSFFIIFVSEFNSSAQVLIPVDVADRKNVKQIKLTSIGKFGIVRKARPGIAAHLHTGIDIRRPRPNYVNEPVFSIASGVVISKRDDGAYAQLIVEHSHNGEHYWTVYEHVAGIIVDVNDVVDPMKPIARFMNKTELDRYGWQFDHFHFEVLKVRPRKLKPDSRKPRRYFQSYSLDCYSDSQLNSRFFDPLDFLSNPTRQF